jgi:hypothetical protein
MRIYVGVQETRGIDAIKFACGIFYFICGRSDSDGKKRVEECKDPTIVYDRKDVVAGQ